MSDEKHVAVTQRNSKPSNQLPDQAAPAIAGRDRVGLQIAGGLFIRPGYFVLVLVVVKIFLVLPALGASSLYRDDAWQALSVRVTTLQELIMSGATAPGFGVLLRAWSRLAGDSTFALQFPALLAGIAGPPLCYLAAREIGLKRTSAWIAGLLMCLSTVHSEQSARVKPYTFDAVAAIVMLLVAKNICDDVKPASRWLLLLCLAAGSFFVSSTAGIVGASLVGFCGARLLYSAVGRAETGRYRIDWYVARDFLPGLLIYGLIAGGWSLYALEIRDNVALREHWAPELVDLDDGVAVAARKLTVSVARSYAVLALMPDQLPRELAAMPFAGMIAIGYVIGLRLLPARYWCLLVAAPTTALVLAAAGAIPLGGGRTDLYLSPFYALAAAQPVEAILRYGAPRAVTAVRIGGLALMATGIWCGRVAYPAEDLRSLTSKVMRRAGPLDKIVITPETTYMVAFYCGMPVRLLPDEMAMTGFTPIVDDDRIVALPGFEFDVRGPVYRRGVRHCVKLVREAAATQPARIWLVDSHLYGEGLTELNDVLEEWEYDCVETVRTENASATVWQVASPGGGATD